MLVQNASKPDTNAQVVPRVAEVDGRAGPKSKTRMADTSDIYVYSAPEPPDLCSTTP